MKRNLINKYWLVLMLMRCSHYPRWRFPSARQVTAASGYVTHVPRLFEFLLGPCPAAAGEQSPKAVLALVSYLHFQDL